MNEARAREIPPSLPATTAWDVVGKSASDVTVCEVKGLKSLSPPAIEKTFAVCKLLFVEREPMAKYNERIERIKSQCELSDGNNETQITCHPRPSCKPCGAPAHNSRPPHTRTLGDTAGQHCLAFNLA